MSDERLLRDTLELTLARDDTFPARFYQRLFAAHPGVVPMFQRNTPGAQRKLFAQKLTAIVDHLGDPGWLERELGAMARSHVGYGVGPEMYAWVGEALIETLREACADAWTADAERAWRTAYGAIADAMVRASG